MRSGTWPTGLGRVATGRPSSWQRMLPRRTWTLPCTFHLLCGGALFPLPSAPSFFHLFLSPPPRPFSPHPCLLGFSSFFLFFFFFGGGRAFRQLLLWRLFQSSCSPTFHRMVRAQPPGALAFQSSGVRVLLPCVPRPPLSHTSVIGIPCCCHVIVTVLAFSLSLSSLFFFWSTTEPFFLGGEGVLPMKHCYRYC